MKLGGSLSYAWQELVRGADESSGVLPKARGLAFFARALDADGSQMRRAGKQDLKTLVIGHTTLCRVGLSFGGSTSTHGVGRVYGDLL
jgi:hypothetical protein